MKKIALCLVLVFGIPAFLWAEENRAEEKVSTYMLLKSNLINPKGEGSYFSYGLFSYWYNSWLGAGVDVTSTPKKEFLEAKPFVTINKGPFYAIGGLSTDSTGADYAFGGYGISRAPRGVRHWWMFGIIGVSAEKQATT